jgi:hypothetical protein
VAVIFGVAIAKSVLLSRWIGGAGVIVGAISIIAGIEVAYVGRDYRCFYVEKNDIKEAVVTRSFTGYNGKNRKSVIQDSWDVLYIMQANCREATEE